MRNESLGVAAGWVRRSLLAFAMVWPALLACAALADEPIAKDQPIANDEPAAPQDQLDPRHAANMRQGLALFKKSVRQVLVGRCLKCHGGDSTESEFDLTTRRQLLKGGAEGPVVVLGQAKQSRLYKLVTHQDEPAMPEDGAMLSDLAIAEIARWIDLGAPYDGPLVTESNDPKAWISLRVPPQARQFWSFQPLLQATVPQPSGDDWSRTDADRFVAAKLQEKDLAPNPVADRRVLIRRAYFDLLGLPPSEEEVQRFVDDADPQAYEKLIDRLLQSPHYGERWARHWLDVARFGESHGFEQDYDRPYAYHYRDFVIKALNSDMPYDRFVRWQLAGDELQPGDPLALMATGFLGAGVFPTQLTEKEFEPSRYDELDDMVGTMGTAMLGLTVGCARCHDHKFDPIPSGDYYRLISTFATTIRSNVELDLDPLKTQRETRQWQRQHQPLSEALARFEREELPARLEQWLALQKEAPQPAPAWSILDPLQYRSQGGAMLRKLEDRSLLASGANPDFDTYTVIAHTHQRGITAVRLEALIHRSLSKSGPGRADNGNFALGSLRVTAEPLSGGGEPITIKLIGARATFEQDNAKLAVAASIDKDKNTGWAVAPRMGEDQTAIFVANKPFGFDGGTKLTFALDFNVNKKHAIGRARLAISTTGSPNQIGFDEASDHQARIEITRLLDGDILDGETLAVSGSGPVGSRREAALAWYRTLDPQWRKLHQKVQNHLRTKPQPQLTKVMIASEGVKPIPHHADGRGFPHFYKDTYYLKRGDANQKVAVARPGYLQVLTLSPDGVEHWRQSPPEGSATSYRRRALAAWITDVEYGPGHLLARVIVNRLWQHHVGRGIVATPSDFGYQGTRPTHPELLDYLAGRLIEGGWRLKPLHKLIMTSSVYMQSAAYDAENAAIDPDNQWWWRRAPRRLEAEIIRDAMLSLSGKLDKTMYGPGTLDQGHHRRSIYFMVKRSKLVPMMQLFDSPEPLVGQGRRPSTTIAPQALMFMNSPYVREYARGFADRLATNDAKSTSGAIRRAYRMALGRNPTEAELAEAVEFVSRQRESYQADALAEGRRLALADLCQVLMSLNEFVYVD